ncbi:MAG: type II toxin-antitoxin system RelE/ParE family toxin [Anaerolineae bacterium]|nr:type II toxin-antitoxin system RelE/ParE family toxin [Anaerolineae bacterium]
MAKYEIVFKASVAKDLHSIPNRDVERILSRISQLAIDPRPPQSIKLSGEEKYRLRQGNYRILYQVDDLVITVTVVKIGHRRDVYR